MRFRWMDPNHPDGRHRRLVLSAECPHCYSASGELCRDLTQNTFPYQEYMHPERFQLARETKRGGWFGDGWGGQV